MFFIMYNNGSQEVFSAKLIASSRESSVDKNIYLCYIKANKGGLPWQKVTKKTLSRQQKIF